MARRGFGFGFNRNRPLGASSGVIGEVFTFDFSSGTKSTGGTTEPLTDLSDFTTENIDGSISISMDDGYMKFTGDPADISDVDAVIYPTNFPISLDQYEYSIDYVIKSYDASNDGISIGLWDDGTNNNQRSEIYYHYRNSAQAANGDVYRTKDNGVATELINSGITPAIDQKYRLKIIRDGATFTVQLILDPDGTPTLLSEDIVYDYTTTSGDLSPRTSFPCIAHVGGEHWVSKITLTSNALKNPDWLVLHDSMGEGYCASSEELSFYKRLVSENPDVTFTRFGAQGDKPESLNQAIEVLKLINPKNIIIFNSTNGVTQDGVGATQTQYTNLMSSINSELSVNKIVHVQPLPRIGSVNFTNYSNWLETTFSSDTVLQNNKAFNPGDNTFHSKYFNVDEIHPSDLGHRVLFEFMDQQVKGSTYSIPAQALFAVNYDTPVYWKEAANSLIQVLIDEGAWDTSGFKMIKIIPTLNRWNTMMDWKSLQVNAEYRTGTIALPASESTRHDAFPTNAGWGWADGSTILRTAITPANDMTLNDSALMWEISETHEAAFTNMWTFGAFNNPQFVGATIRNSTGESRSAMYSTTDNSGKLEVAAHDGAPGRYMHNRRAVDDHEYVINGVVVDTGNAGGTGGLPPFEIWYNSFNNAGTPNGNYDNQSRLLSMTNFGKGLTVEERSNIDAAYSAYEDSNKHITTNKTKLVIWDGNSWNAFHQSAVQRKFLQLLRDEESDVDWYFHTVAVSGKETRESNTNWATEVQPIIDSKAWDEVVMLFLENSNDWWSNFQSPYTLATADTKSEFDSLMTTAFAAGVDKVIVHGAISRSASSSGYTAIETHLATDELNRHVRDEADLDVRLEYVNPPMFFFDFRANYASNAAYQTFMNALYSDLDYYYGDSTHPNEVGAFNIGIGMFNRFREFVLGYSGDPVPYIEPGSEDTLILPKHD